MLGWSCAQSDPDGPQEEVRWCTCKSKSLHTKLQQRHNMGNIASNEASSTANKNDNQRKLGSNLPSYGWLLLNEGWCVTLHHITMSSVRLYSMKGGAWLYITQQWEVCDYIIFNEGWCVTLHHTTMRSVRLCSMKGGVWLYIAQQWEGWDYIQWRVVCDFTSHNNEKQSQNHEKCETMFNEGWCVTLHHITMRSNHRTMRSVRLYSMQDGLKVYITYQLVVWEYTQRRVV